jgi:uncharacterized membrane protein
MPDQESESLSPAAPPRNPRPEKTPLWIYILTLIGFAVFLGGIFLAPWLRSRSSVWTGLVYAIYSPFCHQLPERSLSCFGHPLSVCSRCLGIYLGVLGGLLLYPLIRGWRQVRVPAKKAFILLSTPIFLDAGANLIRLWRSPNAVRLATGFLWGLILPFYFITGVVDLLRQRRKKRRENASLPGHGR